MPKSWQSLMPSVCDIAAQAAEKIMVIYRDSERWQVQTKEDDSPLTAADIAANTLIVAGLSALTPSIPIISEESEEIDFSQRKYWPLCWMVDPLDGTKEFIARNDEFSINIALIENNQAVLGLIFSPVTQTAYTAVRNHGAYRRDKNGHVVRLETKKFKESEGPLQIVASRRHRSVRDMEFREAMANCYGDFELTLAGSAFKICAVAEGLADVYPRFGHTMEWDTAAGQIIVEEAGGALLDAQGLPFRYNQRRSLRNNSFLVTGAAPANWLPLWTPIATRN